ncbi:hypothetical protein R1sor_004931 [Riccia sorocarpa]|uniref:EF-hand domain-containing protein n=1 Tax=Riccia sorocarpa TaxID=122646 RepID=A0ABD3HMF8_9MARC
MTAENDLGVENEIQRVKTDSEEVAPMEAFVQRHKSFKKHEAPAIEKDEIRKVFAFFDDNKDGLISKDDLQLFMNKLGFRMTEEEISSMVHSVDVNGDGSVDFEEFASLYKVMACEDSSAADQQNEDEDLKDAFNVFDKNGDGSISPTELQTVLVNLGMQEGQNISNCEKMINTVDADGNGQVEFYEFKKLMGADFARGGPYHFTVMIDPHILPLFQKWSA